MLLLFFPSQICPLTDRELHTLLALACWKNKKIKEFLAPFFPGVTCFSFVQMLVLIVLQNIAPVNLTVIPSLIKKPDIVDFNVLAACTRYGLCLHGKPLSCFQSSYFGLLLSSHFDYVSTF